MAKLSTSGGLAIMSLTAIWSANAETISSCAKISDDAKRVACYDRVAERPMERSISKFGASCEATLVSKLVSPAGYRLIAMSEARLPIPVEEYVDQQLYAIRDRNLTTPERAVEERAKLRQAEEKMKSDGTMPEKVIVTIVYDAPNRMNAMIRGNEVCTMVELPPL